MTSMEGEESEEMTLAAQLTEAAADGELDALLELLATPEADVNAQDEDGDTALHAACVNGHAAVVRWLLDAGARLDVVNEDGDSVLHAAASGGDATVVNMVMAAGFQGVDIQNEFGWTPAHMAAKAGKAEVLRCLVKHGADLSLTAEDGASVLHVAAAMDNVDAITYLLEEAKMEVDLRDEKHRSPLHRAATAGAADAVKELLRRGAELEARDQEEQTPLFKAALNGHQLVVEILLKSGADVNAVERDGWTVLHGAAQSDEVDMMKFLVERGADLRKLTNDRDSVLHIAASHGSIDAVKYCLENGLDIEAADKSRQTPLFIAALKGHHDVVELLLDEGANINAAEGDGWLPLHGAAQSGDVETIRLLVQRGAALHGLTKDGRSALHFAATMGSEDALKLLQQDGDGLKRINQADEHGWTSVHYAAAKGDREMMALLIKEGADMHAVTKTGQSVLFIAAGKGQTETVKLLIEGGADVNMVEETLGWSALHAAAQFGSEEVVELLLQHGADVNAQDKVGISVLHVAVGRGRVAVAKALIRHGADVKATDESNGWSTFLHAASGGNQELVRLIVEHGEDARAVAKDGKTALHLACSNANHGVVEYLVELDVDVNAIDETGSTPLLCACEAESSECVSFLLGSGARTSVDIPDEDGYRPLHLSSRAHRPEETKALLQAGANVHALTNKGETPLQLAVFASASISASSTASVLCGFGAQWTAKCQEELKAIKDDLEASKVDVADERYEYLRWCTGLRASILFWEQQHCDGVDELLMIPVEVIERGESSVHAYLSDATSSSPNEITYRCKVCVVGPSEWGKSSLVRSIETMRPFLIDAQDRTIGIELVSSSLDDIDSTNEKFEGGDKTLLEEDAANAPSKKHHEVTFWDFAGQDVYQVAHSLFFSRRTLYVLVVDAKAYLDQLDAVKSLRSAAVEAAMDRFLSRHVFRWVRTIFARQPDAEFLVLGTKADLLKKEEEESARVWRDLQSRVYQWKMNYIRELEQEYGSATVSSGRSKARPARGDARARLLSEKLARLASDQWLVVSVTRPDSIHAVRQALQCAIEASERGFPMWSKYSRVLQAINTRRDAANRPGEPRDRLEHGMMLIRPLCQQLMDEVEGLEYDECREILRTLHDLGDVIWYENQDAGELRDFIILDPMLVIDIVREVISHEHKKKTGIPNESHNETEAKPRLDGRVSHSLLETLPLWKYMDKELMYAFKMLLTHFQLAYPADDEVMDPESDLIVPSYWKAQMEASGALSDAVAVLQEDVEVTRPNHHCWEYEVSADLSDAIFEQFAVQSYTSFMKREVRANCIESSCAEFQSWITLHPGKTKHDFIRVEVASEDPDISWLNMRYYLMKLEKVLDKYSGLAVPRYVVVDGKRHSLSPATKAVRDSIMMGRDVKNLRVEMPWLPPDLDWFISRAWRDIAAFKKLQMMHLVRDKLEVLQKLVVKGDSQRRYPALWSLEYKAEERVAVLRMLSDLSGRCYHVPIEIEVPPAFLAKYGSRIKDGISLLSNIIPSSLSVPILQTAIDGAVSCLEAKTEQAAKVHNLIERLDLTAVSTKAMKTSTDLGLSPGGAMAILRDLLKLHNDSLDELSITEVCNLECAVTGKGEYVWAHIHEINMLKKELKLCQPRFETQSAPHEESETPPTLSTSRTSSTSPSKVRLSLCIEKVAGLANWDWYKTYCKWQLLYGDARTPLASGSTPTNTDSNVEPSWRSLKMRIETVETVEMLRECVLVFQVKRHSRIGWTKLIGEGQIELREFVSDDVSLGFSSGPIQVPLRDGNFVSNTRALHCQISTD